MGECPAALRPEHAEAVRVIHQQQCVVTLGEVEQRGQRGDVAVHAEHAVGDDHPLPCSGLCERTFQKGGVAVRIAHRLRTGQPHAVDQRGVVELVRKHRRLAPDKRGDRADVRLIAGGKKQGARQLHVIGQLFLQTLVRDVVSGDQVRRSRPHAVTPHPLDCRFDQARMIGKPEVIVAAEGKVLAPVHRHVRTLRAVERQSMAQEAVALEGVELGGEIVVGH